MSDWTSRLSEGRGTALGVLCDDDGAEVAVFSEHAERIELCLFDERTRETRLTLPGRTGAIHHARVQGLRPGQRYGLRAHGPYAPEEGHRFNPAKLLLDPYARAWDGPLRWHPSQRGACDDGTPDPTDSAPHMPKCLARGPDPVADPSARPHTPWQDTVLYEAHIKGLTQLWPGLPDTQRGRIEGLAHPEVIAHLKALGITAVELLPLHAFLDDERLLRLGLSNYWGYNTAGFFVIEPRYGSLEALRQTVARLHAEGIEVILDVVYNHTAESDHLGPTLAFRGLDNASYYRLDPAGVGGYANESGCGNALDLAHPQVLRLVMDSLRYWVTSVGIDGFRFDLAPLLTRGPGGFDPGSAFLAAVAQDPVLSTVKLIAEPWDIGSEGHRLGRFPAPWAEWNDSFRDGVRAYWKGEAGSTNALAGALLGSATVFDHGARAPWASVNYVACHDGFTTADLTAYTERHNTANGEDGRDGHAHNLSDNLGQEGPSDDPTIEAARRQRRRSLLATALLAQGVPMLLAGDEIGNSQHGNNNAYCQDNEISWIDWSTPDRDLLETVRACLALRRRFGVLRQGVFLHGQAGAGGLPTVQWSGLGSGDPDWHAPTLPGFQLLLQSAAGQPASPPALIACNRSRDNLRLVLPESAQPWTRLLDTARAQAAPGPEDGLIRGQSLVLFACEDGTP
ncbi:MAG: glycogen debranching protein GlgX [Pseudomonadota bacterium]